MNPPLQQKSKAASPLQASKWLQCPLMIDAQEMEELFKELGEFWIVLATGVTKQGEGFLTKDEFLNCYSGYIEALKQGRLPDDARLRAYFSAILTCNLDPLYAVPVGEQQQLIKVAKPVIQLQSHRVDYSTADGKFRSMVFGLDSIFWGIQFSYPQLFQDEYLQVKAVKEGDEFPNTVLFKKLQRWMRAHTVATPFFVNGHRINAPIRLGKECFSWINNHPQLLERQISVMK